MFETSRQLGRIPVIAVQGENGVEQTAFLKKLLAHASMRGSVVLTDSVHRDVALGFDRIETFVCAPTVSAEGCLCCGLNSGLGDALRSLFLRALTKRTKPIDRVFIDATSLAVERIVFTLKHAPFLGQRYLYQATLTVTGPRVAMANQVGAVCEQLCNFDENNILKPI
ncbi:MAG: GTP-binding protein [Zwartia sp.]